MRRQGEGGGSKNSEIEATSLSGNEFLIKQALTKVSRKVSEPPSEALIELAIHNLVCKPKSTHPLRSKGMKPRWTLN